MLVRKDRRSPLLWISCGVIAAHILFLGWLGWVAKPQPVVVRPKKLLAKTVILAEKKVEAPIAQVAPYSPPPKKKKPPKKERPKQEDTRKKELLKQAQESIAKNQKTGDKHRVGKAATAPTSLSGLNIDAIPASGVQLSSQEVGYHDELASLLHLLLSFPEMGAVEVKLTVARSGKVAQVEVLNTESPTNRRYIEKMLPTLQLPKFGSRFGSAAQHTFILTLKNE